MSSPIEICITDFVEDPVDDSAFGINFQINGPGTGVDYLRVAFSEAFVQEFFHLSFTRDIGRQEHRLEQKKRELFILWGVCRIEKWLKGGRQEKNILIDDGHEDMIWAQKIQKGLIKRISTAQDDRTFLYPQN